MNRLAIIVHIYKSDITRQEYVSLTQLKRMLPNYPIFLIAPLNLDIVAYKELLTDHLADVVYFNPRYFKDLNGYNDLLLNQRYYKPFLNYNYMLLYHTDAFIFNSNIEYWLDKDYDYIGAPVYAYDGTPSPRTYLFSGNGGLSLRKTRTFYELSTSFQSVFNIDEIRNDFLNYNWKGKLVRLPYYLSMLTTLGSRLHPLFNRIDINEDAVWGMLVPKYILSFKNASFEEALKFSFEYNCERLFILNGSQLPFGCHGWLKPMFFPFWSNYIRSYGYDI